MAGFGMLAAWFVACAGEDIPPIDNDLRGALADGYGGAAQVGSGGGAGGNAGSGDAGSANAGSANAGSGNPGGGAGGGEPVGNAGSGGGGECDAFNTIIQPRCGTAGCHNEGAGAGEFGASEALAAEYIDEPSISFCDGLVIDSANVEESLLYTKLSEASPQGCGSLQMPANGDLLTDEEIACVLGWLQQFAD